MKAITQNGILVITLSGRIDANNAQEVEQQLLEAIRGKEDVPLQLDMEELNYLSSVGLRVLLRLQKGRKEKIRMLRVRPEVYEILQLTGFTELFDVNRQLREVTVEACPIIGQGANGTVYRLEEDKILKLYRPGHTLEEIDRERRLAREAFISGIPSVITYDTVRCGESYGIVFERMKSDTLGHAFADGKKEIGELVQRYVDFFRTLHQIPIKPGTFPELKDEYAVLEVDDRYSPKVKLCSLATGRTGVMKLKKALYRYQPLEAGEILRLLSWERRPAYQYVDGKARVRHDTSDLWITDYELVV